MISISSSLTRVARTSGVRQLSLLKTTLFDYHVELGLSHPLFHHIA